MPHAEVRQEIIIDVSSSRERIEQQNVHIVIAKRAISEDASLLQGYCQHHVVSTQLL